MARPQVIKYHVGCSGREVLAGSWVLWRFQNSLSFRLTAVESHILLMRQLEVVFCSAAAVNKLLVLFVCR